MKTADKISLDDLLKEIRHCSLCTPHIPSPNPVLSASASAQILIIGQAPGTKVHASGIPWNDASGNRLREWMGISEAAFYDQSQVAILPMGFCYPGKGKSGDLAPRPECADAWHSKVLEHLPNIECTLLIGQYAQRRYCPAAGETVTERVKSWQKFAPQQFLLPHPSPRNQPWLKHNPWFEQATIPAMQSVLKKLIGPPHSAL